MIHMVIDTTMRWREGRQCQEGGGLVEVQVLFPQSLRTIVVNIRCPILKVAATPTLQNEITIGKIRITSSRVFLK